MWISKKRWRDLERRVANLEKAQSQPIDGKIIYEAFRENTKEIMKREGRPAFNC